MSVTRSLEEKAWESSVRAFTVIFLFSSPMFSLTDGILKFLRIGNGCSGGCPTLTAIILHGLIFFLIDYFLLVGDKDMDPQL